MRRPRNTLRCPKTGRGFTLLELLVVISIIGALAALSIPAMRNLRRSQSTTTAERQLMDDIAFARLRSMSDRTEVYLVFVPPVGTPNVTGSDTFPYYPALTAQEKAQVEKLLPVQCSSYALFASRRVGDQPGSPTPRYLTAWRHLPEGMFIATNKFQGITLNSVLPFEWVALPFPFETSPARPMPCIHFDAQGRVVGGRDEVVPLARGNVYAQSDGSGNPVPPRVDENPPGNAILAYNHVRIDWLTGRARAEKRELP